MGTVTAGARRRVVVALSVLWGASVLGAAQSFPGAVGYGAQAAGGRGGQVLFVTSLANSGAGTLRAACEASGARTVVFRVGGTILLSSRINIDDPFLTIAGETAPGDGIQIRTNGFAGDNAALWITTHDVIVRHLRIRTAPPSSGETGDTWEYWVDAITLWTTGAYNVMIDHVSSSWGSKDEMRAWDGPHDFTIQNCILSEGLKSNQHKGSLVGGGATRVTFYRNLFAHNQGRNPFVKGDEDDGSLVAMFQVVNNVVYNWGKEGIKIGQAPATTRVNLVGNFYKRGPNSPAVQNFTEIQVYDGSESLTKVFVSGNISPLRTSGSQDEWANVGVYVYPNSGVFSQAPRGYQSLTPFDMPSMPTVSATLAYDSVLAGVGAARPARDTVDRRVVADVRNGTGSIIDVPEEVGGWPLLASGTPYADADQDGISDAWESNHGGDIDNNAKTVDGAGRYTNLECFLQELSGDTVYGGVTRALTHARPSTNGGDSRTVAGAVAADGRKCPVVKRAPGVIVTAEPMSAAKPARAKAVLQSK